MRKRPDPAVVALVVLLVVQAAAAPKPDAAAGDTSPGSKAKAEKPKGGTLFDFGPAGKSKEPITIVSDTLDYDYKNGIAVYRGSVVATQGEVKLVSDTLRITFEDAPPSDGAAKPGATKPTATPGAAPDAAAKPASAKPTAAPAPAADADGPTGGRRVKEVIADGNVRIDQPPKWATGGHAIFEQSDRTVVLTQNPMLHDGKNEVAGDRVVVYLDEDRSTVEAGRKRVKAVLYPDKDHNLAPQPKTDATAASNGAAPAPALDQAAGR
jgi:lipopolysaccharide export system protein LptA